ncbi:MAG: diguanylate cyclase domain-containing protein [Pseudomonadota bacterium]
MIHKPDSALDVILVWILPLLLWSGVVAFSLAWNLSEARRTNDTLMSTQGREIFRIIEATRFWNASHGGLYGRRSEASPSNPYLEAEEKDIDTPSGVPLTLLNPAYMTRQLSRVIEERSGIRINITSLKPINPGNQALPWERDALRQFESGAKEFFSLAKEGEDQRAHYMAPLVTQPICLQCHAKQGYQVGDIRGGISVSFDATPYVQAYQTRRANLVLIHAGVWLGLVLTALIGVGVVRKRNHALRAEMAERKGAESYLRALVNASPDPMFGIDRRGRCTFANPAAQAALGFPSLEAMLGRNLIEEVIEREYAVAGHHDASILRALEQGKRIEHEQTRFQRHEGESFAAQFSLSPILSEARVVGGVVTFMDVSDRRRNEVELWLQASHDVLTELPNKLLLLDRFEAALAQASRHQGHVGLVLIALDAFPALIERYGENIADAMLKVVAMRMKETVRATDTLARLDKDVFAILLPLPVSPDEVVQIGERVRRDLAKSYRVGPEWVEVPVSIGWAVYPDHADHVSALLQHAREQLGGTRASGAD